MAFNSVFADHGRFRPPLHHFPMWIHTIKHGTRSVSVCPHFFASISRGSAVELRSKLCFSRFRGLQQQRQQQTAVRVHAYWCVCLWMLVLRVFFLHYKHYKNADKCKGTQASFKMLCLKR